MRIALLNTEAHRGGAAKMATTLTCALANQGEDVTFFHAGSRTQQVPSVGLRRPGSRQINAFLARVGGSMTVCDFGLVDELLERIANADVLHIHNLHGYYLNYRRLLSAWRDRPIVWTWHDQWGATGRCAVPITTCDKWQTGCGHCPQQDVYPSAWVDRSAEEYRLKTAIYQQLNRLLIVTPCQWLRDRAIARGFAPERVRVIPNPVMLDKFKPQDQDLARQMLGLPRKEPLILFVASDCNDVRKGYLDFESLVDTLNVTAVAVGKPPRRRSAKIHYAGSIKEPERLAAYYSAANLLIVTTQADNYPNVNIEAMACGTPLLSYSVGGIPDQMPAFWDGLISINDMATLTQRSRALLSDTTQLCQMRSALREHALATWAPNIVAVRYRQAYEESMCLSPAASNEAIFG